jgi:hypothetical protein
LDAHSARDRRSCGPGGGRQPINADPYHPQADVDRGTAGGDNIYGAGELILFSPPNGPEPGVPTIYSFNPTSGPVGTSVVITGTGFDDATSVTFGGAFASFEVNSAMQITTTVPTDAVTGQIAVTTPYGTGMSVGAFVVTAPLQHSRSVTFFDAGRPARGRVTVSDGYNLCRSNVPITLQERTSRRWRTLDRSCPVKWWRLRSAILAPHAI